MSRYRVTADVATGWASPDSPRPLDAPALADDPDPAAWVAALATPEDRRGLHGRTLTQLLAGEPALPVEEAGEWVRVSAPWQPAPNDTGGYLCWVRRAHLRPEDGGPHPPPPPSPEIAPDPDSVLRYAHRFLGLEYLWGGTSPYGLDCSGLVHYCFRKAGIVVPRDSPAQQAAAEPVPLGQERPGDVYFFAADGTRVTHVGFVTDRLRMLHAPEGTRYVEDAPLAPERRATLVSAGRFALR